MKPWRAAVLLALGAACGGACGGAPRAKPLENAAPPAQARRPALPPPCPAVEPGLVGVPGLAVGAIAGAVVDEHCERLAGATVLVRTGASPRGAVDITDEAGRFVIRDLPPGRYVLSVYYLDMTLDRGGVDVRAGEVEHVQLSMPPPAKSAPRITSDLLGAP